ncbi:MAG: cation:proton antiporter [Gemmatimonadota bacterium]
MVNARKTKRGGRARRWVWRIAAGAGLWMVMGVPFPSAGSAVTQDAGAPEPATATAPAGQDSATPVDELGQDATGEAAAGDEAGADDHGAAAEGEGGGGGDHGPEISHVFLVIITILIVGKLFGEVAERNGQPAVLGELVAGVILGGSVLGVIPASGPMYEIVHVLAEIGVAILLFEIGLETDLKEMSRVGGTAFGVAMIGVFLPFALGFGYWYLFNPSIGAHPEGISFAIVAVFVGATLTATSVGITARVLSDLNRMHTPEARIIIGAAVIDDVLGIVILSVVSGLAGGAAVTLGYVSKTLLFAVGFLVLAVVIGNRFAPALFNLVNQMRVRGSLLVAAFCFALGVAALADLAGSALIIGAFAAGLVLSSTNQFDTVVERIEPVADVFTPIFFVAVGAPVNVGLFLPMSDDFNLGVLIVGLILTVIAIIGKLVSGLAVRREDTSKLLVGVGMVPRGEVGLIFASIGLTAGILSGSVYSAILIMVILSTFVVPPVLKVLFARKAEPDAEGMVRVDGSAH